MSLLKRFSEHVQSQKLFGAADHLLIAVSGGLDSVVLCHLCKEAGYAFSIAHCHFGLRGVESDRDAAFVQALAKSAGVSFYIKYFDTAAFARENSVTIQVAARNLRYSWFSELMAENPQLKWLLTAHHADDNVETTLMQFCKGTGITGLKGIPQKRGTVIRPMLFADRTTIESYAAEHGLSWVEDSSNEEVKYTRNYFRHIILPAIEKVMPQVRSNIADNIVRLTEAESLYQQSVDSHKNRLLECRGSEVHIPVLKLERTMPLKTIIVEIIKDYNFTPQQAGEVIKLLRADSGKYITSPTHRILKNRKWLIISPLHIQEQSLIIIDAQTDAVKTRNGALTILRHEANAVQRNDDTSVALLAEEEVLFPLILRKWKAGDYFYPLGMKKKKKLARFFIDQKLSMVDKEALWVIETGKRIAWIVNHRIDDRFKITPRTKRIVQLSWSTP